MMTIELSLRRRATHARYLAALWLTAAVVFLGGTSLHLPRAATNLLSAVTTIESPTFKADATTRDAGQDLKKAAGSSYVFTLTILGFGVAAIGFASYLLSRAAMFEVALAARFSGLADALCLAGNEIKRLEEIAPFVIPPVTPIESRLFAPEDVKLVADVIKQAK